MSWNRRLDARLWAWPLLVPSATSCAGPCRGWVRVHVLTIAHYPVLRDNALCRREIECAGAHAPVQLVFQRVLHVRVPGRRAKRLWPEVAYRVGSAQLEADEMIDLVRPWLVPA